MNKYLALKKKHQKEVNEFPFGFAFGNQQFKEMMKNLDLKKQTQTKYIQSVLVDILKRLMQRQCTICLKDIDKKRNGNLLNKQDIII